MNLLSRRFDGLRVRQAPDARCPGNSRNDRKARHRAKPVGVKRSEPDLMVPAPPKESNSQDHVSQFSHSSDLPMPLHICTSITSTLPARSAARAAGDRKSKTGRVRAGRFHTLPVIQTFTMSPIDIRQAVILRKRTTMFLASFPLSNGRIPSMYARCSGVSAISSASMLARSCSGLRPPMMGKTNGALCIVYAMATVYCS